MTTTVIDISSWQHPSGAPIEWTKVAQSGVSGVIIKATQSTNYLNPYFHADMEGALAAGLMVGAYHYAQPGMSDAAAQAAWYWEAVQQYVMHLGSWLDFEESDGMGWPALGEWATEWVDHLNTPQNPTGVYCNLSWYANLYSIFPATRSWIAAWGGQALPQGAVPILVQTGSGPIAGISGAVDVNAWANPRALNPPAAPAPAPGAAPAPAPWVGIPPAQLGDTGPHVLWVQERLYAWGYGLALDSVYGPITHEDVVEAQGLAKVAQDGIVGPETWRALSEGKPETAPAPAPVSHPPTLTEGASGVDVGLLQAALRARGDHLAVDGQFGPLTEGAVRAYQASQHLAVDGIVGPQTWASLGH